MLLSRLGEGIGERPRNRREERNVAPDEESSGEPKGRNGKSRMNSMALNGQLRPIPLTYFETALYTEKTFGTMTESRGWRLSAGAPFHEAPAGPPERNGRT